LSKLRDRIGVVPLQLLFGALTRPTPTRCGRGRMRSGCWCARGTATEIAVADTAANRSISGGTVTATGPAGRVPKTRLMVLLGVVPARSWAR